jgi:hypothetical protein
MPEMSMDRGQKKCSPWSFKLDFGSGANPTMEKIDCYDIMLDAKTNSAVTQTEN